nr:hypothetical protein BaRGS_027928 [Batillaria attramentaria]
MDSYYYVTHKTTRDAYDSLVQHFKEDPVHVPTLFFHSKDDPLCDPDAMEMMLAKWRSPLVFAAYFAAGEKNFFHVHYHYYFLLSTPDQAGEI